MCKEAVRRKRKWEDFGQGILRRSNVQMTKTKWRAKDLVVVVSVCVLVRPASHLI